MSYYDSDFTDVYTGRVLEEGELGNRDCNGVTRFCTGYCDSCRVSYDKTIDCIDNNLFTGYNRYNPGYTDESFKW